ncbi:AcrR family transcriptional regulator [Kitasatospora sp. MAP12-15]|uniref:TetR/AcrR family transcriptional regulator n=1 Tax=unclassified Kitasatospora TaxID=2633591 RepID=UPI002474741B|nr:helix-turn-helix domain-containing protein [Kitasatospora sp. MAP12-44]MDH6111045.1 AcrR family transcriptional regulator [Kitasatospora sp. MAP12-44]
MAKTSMRMSAEERRESVIRAAITEFAKHGYHGTSTEAIARRVGVSQPYLFRLFGSKQALFLAAGRSCTAGIRAAFERAAEGCDPEQARDAMSQEYQRLLEDRERLLMQMQMYVAVSSAEIEGDHEFGAAVRESWSELYDFVHLTLGADSRQTADFMSFGMLMNVLLLLGYPQDHRVWDGLLRGTPADADTP